MLVLATDRGAPLKSSALKAIAAVLTAYLKPKAKLEVFVAWAGLAKMRVLNRTWRGKDKPTNVLSYPQFEPAELKQAIKKTGPRATLHIGDVVLCLPYIKSESRTLKKPLNAHLAHLVVHGVLHLLGYDHIKGRQAKTMEKLERKILAELGLSDPYAVTKPVPRKRRKKA